MSPSSTAKTQIIPIFLPMVGCAYRCVYCDQHAIAPTERQLHPSELPRHVAEYTATRNPSLSQPLPLVAFFGGSFAQLPLSTIRQWVDAVAKLEQKGKISGFICSARPDGWQPETFELFRHATCHRVELGIQSTSQEILRRAGRPKITPTDLECLFTHLRQTTQEIGVQLLYGLPGENHQTWQQTICDTIAMQPDGVRLYPVVILARTMLETMWLQGEYTPPTLEAAVQACTDATLRFTKQNIVVWRSGLQDSLQLRQQIVAGPWHPAFGELIKSEIYRRELLRLPSAATAIAVHPRDMSALVGHGGSNRDLLKTIRVEPDQTVARGEIVWKTFLTSHPV